MAARDGSRLDIRCVARSLLKRITPRFITIAAPKLSMCNGTFSQPKMAELDGAAEFQSSGGMLSHSSRWPGNAVVKGRHLLVVGYGKSSCDLAQAVSGEAASTTLVVRQSIWKMPKKLFHVLNEVAPVSRILFQ